MPTPGSASTAEVIVAVAPSGWEVGRATFVYEEAVDDGEPSGDQDTSPETNGGTGGDDTNDGTDGGAGGEGGTEGDGATDGDTANGDGGTETGTTAD